MEGFEPSYEGGEEGRKGGEEARKGGRKEGRKEGWKEERRKGKEGKTKVLINKGKEEINKSVSLYSNDIRNELEAPRNTVPLRHDLHHSHSQFDIFTLHFFFFYINNTCPPVR